MHYGIPVILGEPGKFVQGGVKLPFFVYLISSGVSPPSELLPCESFFPSLTQVCLSAFFDCPFFSPIPLLSLLFAQSCCPRRVRIDLIPNDFLLL